MTATNRLTTTALGVAGGLAGTMAIQGLMAIDHRYDPECTPPIREDPGEFMVEWAEEVLPSSVRRNIPGSAEHAAAGALAMGYGLAFGAVYGAIRPRGGDPLVEGLALGAACWAAGYLGWLPALGLMPPLSKQTPSQILGPFVEHLVYGMTTVAAFDLLRQCADTCLSSEA